MCSDVTSDTGDGDATASGGHVSRSTVDHFDATRVAADPALVAATVDLDPAAVRPHIGRLGVADDDAAGPCGDGNVAHRSDDLHRAGVGADDHVRCSGYANGQLAAGALDGDEAGLTVLARAAIDDDVGAILADHADRT